MQQPESFRELSAKLSKEYFEKQGDLSAVVSCEEIEKAVGAANYKKAICLMLANPELAYSDSLLTQIKKVKRYLVLAYTNYVDSLPDNDYAISELNKGLNANTPLGKFISESTSYFSKPVSDAVDTLEKKIKSLYGEAITQQGKTRSVDIPEKWTRSDVSLLTYYRNRILRAIEQDNLSAFDSTFSPLSFMMIVHCSPEEIKALLTAKNNEGLDMVELCATKKNLSVAIVLLLKFAPYLDYTKNDKVGEQFVNGIKNSEVFQHMSKSFEWAIPMFTQYKTIQNSPSANTQKQMFTQVFGEFGAFFNSKCYVGKVFTSQFKEFLQSLNRLLTALNMPALIDEEGKIISKNHQEMIAKTNFQIVRTGGQVEDDYTAIEAKITQDAARLIESIVQRTPCSVIMDYQSWPWVLVLSNTSNKYKMTPLEAAINNNNIPRIIELTEQIQFSDYSGLSSKPTSIFEQLMAKREMIVGHLINEAKEEAQKGKNSMYPNMFPNMPHMPGLPTPSPTDKLNFLLAHPHDTLLHKLIWTRKDFAKACPELVKRIEDTITELGGWPRTKNGENNPKITVIVQNKNT